MTKGILRHSELNVIFRESDLHDGDAGRIPPQALPDHNYLQHHLGDDEDWGVTQRTAAYHQVSLPIDTAKHYTRFNPYQIDPKDLVGSPEVQQQTHDYMQGLEHTLTNQGWSGFKNLPALGVGRSGQHAVVEDGTHRIWAADKLGLSHVPVNISDDEDDDWAEQYGSPMEEGLRGALKQHTAAPLTPAQPIDMAKQDMTYTGPAPGSSHGAEIHQGAGNTQWLVKKAPPQAQSMVEMDVAANRIASHSGLEAPATFKMNTPEGGTASAQLMYPGAKDAYPGKGKIDPESIPDDDLLTFQKHHALDWMLSNHDDHNRNFIRTQDGKMVGIDKGQAMKFINNDRLHWNFFPNEHEPVHNTLYRNMAQGGRVLNDPRQGELGKYIQGLQDIPDEDYQNMLRPYAEQAAKEGMLAKDWKGAGYTPHHGGENVMADPRMAPNDPDAFLNVATQRKNTLMNDFGKLYDRAMTHRNTGTGIA